MTENMNKRIHLMLIGGIIAGPIYIIVGIAQILTREGFDIARHPLSFISLGDLGWIQITNFIVTGLLVLLAAPETMSWHGLLHFLFGTVGFLSLIAASFVYARYFAASRERAWAAFSALTGIIFLAAIVAAPVSGNTTWALMLLYIAVALGWLWLSAILVRTLKRVASRAACVSSYK